MFIILCSEFFHFVETGSWIRTHRGAASQSTADMSHWLVNNLPALSIEFQFQYLWPRYLHCSCNEGQAPVATAQMTIFKSTKAINNRVFTFQLKTQAELPQSCKKRLVTQECQFMLHPPHCWSVPTEQEPQIERDGLAREELAHCYGLYTKK